MIIRTVHLKNFRNFSDKTFQFKSRLNVIYGLNGQGKTNLLESLSFLCLTKSFRTKADADLIRHGEDGFSLSAQVELDSGIEKKIAISYSRDSGKKILIDENRIPSALDFIGLFPIVVLAPEDDEITTGPPEERRRFINLILSQLDKQYLFALRDYVRVVRQRNKILQMAQNSRYRFSEKIEPWNLEYFQKGLEITQKRKEFLDQLKERVKPIHRKISAGLEEFDLRYEPSFREEWSSFEEFRTYLDEIVNQEIMRGTTLCGPHRDEVRFFVNGNELRRFGSRGQHRTVLLSLKIGEYLFLKEKHQEIPVFLLDDVYSEIDEVREKALNEYFQELKQIFLTTHGEDVKLKITGEIGKEIQYIYISSQDVHSGTELLKN